MSYLSKKLDELATEEIEIQESIEYYKDKAHKANVIAKVSISIALGMAVSALIATLIVGTSSFVPLVVGVCSILPTLINIASIVTEKKSNEEILSYQFDLDAVHQEKLEVIEELNKSYTKETSNGVIKDHIYYQSSIKVKTEDQSEKERE